MSLYFPDAIDSPVLLNIIFYFYVYEYWDEKYTYIVHVLMHIELNRFLNVLLTIKSRSEMMAPKVIDMTGPISGETSIAAVMLGALFSTNPSAAKELGKQMLFKIRMQKNDQYK